MKNKIGCILMIILMAGFAQAQEAEFSESDMQSTDTSQYKKFNVKFDDEMVKGAAEKPEVEYLFQRGDVNFKKLIRLRENFIPEVQKGKDDMR
ncbi:MAG: hypothetical protein ACXWC9_07610, partial [Pseudobdellovibrionaceae bacterium]